MGQSPEKRGATEYTYGSCGLVYSNPPFGPQVRAGPGHRVVVNQCQVCHIVAMQVCHIVAMQNH